MDEEYVEAVLGVVERIPRGRVCTYGVVSDAVRERLPRGAARNVGAVMAAYGAGVRWWRVVRADGTMRPDLTDRARPEWRVEGTPLRHADRVDLDRALWVPPELAGPTAHAAHAEVSDPGAGLSPR